MRRCGSTWRSATRCARCGERGVAGARSVVRVAWCEWHGARGVVRVAWCAWRGACGMRAHKIRRGARAREMRRGVRRGVRAHEMRRGVHRGVRAHEPHCKE